MSSVTRLAGIATLTLLLGWALWESRWQPQLPAAPAAGDLPAAPEALPAPTFAPLGDYPVTLTRPLFFPGRRPPGSTEPGSTAGTAGATTATGSTAPASRLKLTAVIEEDGQFSALLQAPGEQVSQRLTVGQSLAGWRLVAIDANQVTVASGDRREQIPLRNFGNNNTATTPAPAPAGSTPRRPPFLPPPAAMQPTGGTNPMAAPE